MFSSLFAKKDPANIVAFCNDRLVTWYRNALNDYGVMGHGVAHFDAAEDEIVITFMEEGKTYVHREEFWQDKGLEYTFNVWSEQPQMNLA